MIDAIMQSPAQVQAWSSSATAFDVLTARGSSPTNLATSPSDASPQTGNAKFAQALASHTSEDQEKEGTVNNTVREQSRKLVATTFIQPLLARMREDPFKSDLFHGGFAEDTFGAQLDTIFADRMVDQMDTRAAAQPNEASGAALVDMVYQKIMSHPSLARRTDLGTRAAAYKEAATSATSATSGKVAEIHDE